MGKLATAALLLSLVACSEQVETPVNELHRQAAELPLQKRYAMYLDVYMSSIPPDPVLARDVVQLGKPARDFTYEKAVSADKIAHFSAALIVLTEFDDHCSPVEIAGLTAKAENLSSDADQKRALSRFVRVACKLDRPLAGAAVQKR